FLLPVDAQLCGHAALDEGPTHGGRLALQLDEFGGVFRRQRVGDGGHELGHLHDRTLEPAKRRRELDCILAAIERDAEQPRPGDARRNSAHVGADARITGSAGGETIGFAVGHEHGKFYEPNIGRLSRKITSCELLRDAVVLHGSSCIPRQPSSSSSSIMRSMTPSPPCQNAGSRASRPKGASSSEWCLVPPAASISR